MLANTEQSTKLMQFLILNIICICIMYGIAFQSAYKITTFFCDFYHNHFGYLNQRNKTKKNKNSKIACSIPNNERKLYTYTENLFKITYT